MSISSSAPPAAIQAALSSVRGIRHWDYTVELTPDQQRSARACGISFFPASPAQVQRLTMQKRIFRLDGQPVMATRDGAYWETHGTLIQMIGAHLREMAQHITVQPASLGDALASSTPAAVGVLVVAEKPDEGMAAPVRTTGKPLAAEAVVVGTPPLTADVHEAEIAVRPTGAGEEAHPAPHKRGRDRPRKPQKEAQQGAEGAELSDGSAAAAQSSQFPDGHCEAAQEPLSDNGAASPDGSATPAAVMRRTRGPGRPRAGAAQPQGHLDFGVPGDGTAQAAATAPEALPDGDVVSEGRMNTVSRQPRVRGPKLPRWMTAGKARRGRLK